MWRFLAVTIALVLGSGAILSLNAVRIKDISFLKGGQSNQLIGFSLVIGLNGTGDSPQSLSSRMPLVNALDRLGVVVAPEDIRGRSVAAVIITATLPPYAKQGKRIDVVVSAIGDAITLKGGVLAMTPLRAANSEIYAISQGLITDIPSGIELPASFELTGNQPLERDPKQNYLPTVGRVVNGALIEKSLDFDLNLRTKLSLNLIEPDFTTAYRVSQAINRTFGDNTARAEDAGAVSISVPQTYLNQVVELISKIENLEVLDDKIAKVIIDEKTGIVVIGENVIIDPVAISYKDLNLLIREQGVFPNTAYSPRALKDSLDTSPLVDPNQNQAQLPGGADQIVDKSILPLSEQEKNNLLVFSGGVNLKEIVSGLNVIGVTNQELIDILKNIKAAGAMKAELVFR